MATRKTNQSSSGTKRKSSGSSNSSKPRTTSSGSSKPRSSTTSKKPVAKAPEPVNTSDFWESFRKSKAFAPILTIVIIVVGVLLDVLFAWNNYDRFFLILGIELIFVAAAWIILLLVNIGSDVMKENE